MNSKIRYIDSFTRNAIYRKICSKFLANNSRLMNMYRRSVPDYEDGGELIAKYLQAGKPFSLIRPGMVEIRDFAIWEEKKLFGRELRKRIQNSSYDFDKDERDRYERLIGDSFGNADIIAAFQSMPIEEYLIDTYGKQAEVIWDISIEPIVAKRPWTLSLTGKKVLVVSPFARFIQSQVDRITEIYPGKELLPGDMEIKAISSVWYIDRGDSGFKTWFDALQYLRDAVMREEFDVALLSCGPFAIDLANEIKKSGRSAIQYAGSLQMLFGIMGERWTNSSMYKPFFENNSAWIRVKPDDVSISDSNASQLDSGCYW